MADNVDEFILKYNVDIAEAMRKLDALNAKLDKTGKAHKSSVAGFGKEIKAVAAEAAMVAGAVAAAWAIVAKGINMAVEAMKDYNEQSLIARRTGLGAIAQDVIAGNLATSSRGRVDRMASRQAVNSVADIVSAAYRDPTRSNQQNVKLRMMGISPNNSSGAVANTGDVMNQLSKRWAAMTTEMAEAEAQLLGLTPQAADAIRDLGGAVTDTTSTTLIAAKRQKDAADAAKTLNEATTGITEDFGTMAKVLTDEAMPALSKYYKQIQQDTHNFANKLHDEGTKGFLEHSGRYFKQAWSNFVGGKGLPTSREEQDELWGETAVQKTEDQKKEGAKQVQEIVAGQNEAAEKQQQAAEKQELTVNQFSAAVAAMPGSLSMQQAIAAWAGEAAKGATVGGAGGMPGTGSSRDPGGPRHVSTVSDGPVVSAMMAKGWSKEQAIGIAANLQHESNFNPAAVGDGGKAYGVGQWHPDRQANFRKLMGKDIQGSSLEDQLTFLDWELRNSESGAGNRLKGARSAGDAASIISQYYERPADRAGEAARRAATATRMAGGVGRGMGLSESQRLMTSAGIAASLGINAEQFGREGASRGDVQYAIDAQRKGMSLAIVKLENEVKSYQAAGKPLVASQKEGELFRMRQQMQSFDTYAPGILASARPGGQERTEGMPPIQQLTININGAMDPVAVSNEVRKVMGQEMKKVVNDVSTKHTS